MRPPRLLLIPALLLSAAASADAQQVSSMSEAEATALAATVIPTVESLRGLEFKREVPVKLVDDAAARKHFQARLDRLLPASQMRAEQRVYQDLGLLPEDLDLRALLFDLLEEQAGGYYDPQSGTFFLLGDMPQAIVTILMAHELTHALDDQHFGLDTTIESILADEDRTDAFGCILEGSGTLVMTVFVTQQTLAGKIDVAALMEFQKTEAGRAAKLSEAPAVLQRALLGPYILGQSFLVRGNLLAMVAGINADDINRAFRTPPASFEQVLHPEKYWDEDKRDDPRAIDLPDLAGLMGDGWSVEAQGTLGELDLAVLTGSGAVAPDSLTALQSSTWTNEAASGWGGDRWYLLRKGSRHVTLVATLWDSVADAQEFSAAAVLPEGVTLSMREDAVVLVAGDGGEETAALGVAVLDALSPAPPAASGAR